MRRFALPRYTDLGTQPSHASLQTRPQPGPATPLIAAVELLRFVAAM